MCEAIKKYDDVLPPLFNRLECPHNSFLLIEMPPLFVPHNGDDQNDGRRVDSDSASELAKTPHLNLGGNYSVALCRGH